MFISQYLVIDIILTCHRSWLTGGAAYGTPKKVSIVFVTESEKVAYHYVNLYMVTIERDYILDLIS